MHILENIGYFFLSIFFVLALIYTLQMLNVNKTLETIDKDLQERLQIRFFSFNRPFMTYVFKKKYLVSGDQRIIKPCRQLYYCGWAMQWAFNIGIGAMLLFVIIRS